MLFNLPGALMSLDRPLAVLWPAEDSVDQALLLDTYCAARLPGYYCSEPVDAV